MLKTLAIPIAILSLAAFLASPALASGEDELFGLGIGAVTGSVAGNAATHGSFAGTAGGSLLGAYAGDRIGASMDQSGNETAGSGVSYAPISMFDDPRPSSFYNPYTPNYVAPDAPDPATVYSNSYGGYCREFSQHLPNGGEAYGTACLQPDGSWRAIQ